MSNYTKFKNVNNMRLTYLCNASIISGLFLISSNEAYYIFSYQWDNYHLQSIPMAMIHVKGQQEDMREENNK